MAGTQCSLFTIQQVSRGTDIILHIEQIGNKHKNKENENNQENEECEEYDDDNDNYTDLIGGLFYKFTYAFITQRLNSALVSFFAIVASFLFLLKLFIANN